MAEIEKIKQDIRSKILKIANKEIAEDDVNVLGKPYYLEPRSLVYLFMEVQQDLMPGPFPPIYLFPKY